MSTKHKHKLGRHPETWRLVLRQFRRWQGKLVRERNRTAWRLAAVNDALGQPEVPPPTDLPLSPEQVIASLTPLEPGTAAVANPAVTTTGETEANPFVEQKLD